MYFYCIRQFEKFSKKNYKYRVRQASTFRELWLYCLKKDKIVLNVNFQYSDSNVFDEYGTKDNLVSLFLCFKIPIDFVFKHCKFKS